TGLYLTSDLAAIKYRLDNWKPSKIIYCIDVRQQLHLRQAFNIAHRAWDQDGLDTTELFHAYNGFIKLKEGAMSTRKGTVIFLKDLIEEGYKRTEDILKSKGANLSKEDIKAITIAAIKYSYLSVDREKDVVFDWDKALNFEGNSGPYIQYAYVRAKNIIEKSGEKVPVPSVPVPSVPVPLSAHDTSCLRKLTFFEKAVSDTAAKYKPHILATYCYELASEFSSWYAHTPKVLEEPDLSLKNFRLTLVEQVRDTLQKGFALLAIEMPGKM
ncbi:MAG: arginine--tRNA ligase, partial [Candidatus Gracilibacteria bacterium]|nr:arginine--tRNA ligase [Candidatus Gracilibacteria bacterium]